MVAVMLIDDHPTAAICRAQELKLISCWTAS